MKYVQGQVTITQQMFEEAMAAKQQEEQDLADVIDMLDRARQKKGLPTIRRRPRITTTVPAPTPRYPIAYPISYPTVRVDTTCTVCSGVIQSGQMYVPSPTIIGKGRHLGCLP